MQQIVITARLIGRNMDRFPLTKTRYFYELNSDLNQANQGDKKPKDDRTVEISHLAVKEKTVTRFGVSQKKVIFYSTEKVPGKYLFENLEYKEKIISNTLKVKEHLTSHLKENMNASEGYFHFLERTLYSDVLVPRPHTNEEIEIFDAYQAASNEVNNLSRNLREKKLTLDIMESMLANLDEKKLPEEDFKNILTNLDTKKLSERELKIILADLTKKSSNEKLKISENSKEKLSQEKFLDLEAILVSKKNDLSKEIQDLISDLEPKKLKSNFLESKSMELQKASVSEGISINLVNGVDFLEFANKFQLKIRKSAKINEIAQEETIKSNYTKTSENTETKSIAGQLDSNDLSDKENISSDSKDKSKITNNTKLPSQAWSTAKNSSPRTPGNFLNSKQTTTFSSIVKPTTDTNLNSPLIANSEESLASDSSSISEEKSIETVANQTPPEKTTSPRSARDIGNDKLLKSILPNPNKLNKPNN